MDLSVPPATGSRHWIRISRRRHSGESGGPPSSTALSGHSAIEGESPLGNPDASREPTMSDVVYRSSVRIERIRGPLRHATLPATAQAVPFGVHAEIAEHYGVDTSVVEPQATTLDYVIAATGG